MTNLIEIDPQTAKDWSDRGEAELIDVREDNELIDFSIAGATHNPMSNFDFDAIPWKSVPRVILSADAWTGYPGERAELLGYLRSRRIDL